MENDRDLRDILLLLVKAHKTYQVRALSLNTALSAIMDLPPTKKASLTPTQVHAEVRKAEDQARHLADEQSEQLEEALSGSNRFLEALRVYATRQLLL